jgi:hypothetical protein
LLLAGECGFLCRLFVDKHVPVSYGENLLWSDTSLLLCQPAASYATAAPVGNDE